MTAEEIPGNPYASSIEGKLIYEPKTHVIVDALMAVAWEQRTANEMTFDATKDELSESVRESTKHRLGLS